MIEAIFEFLLQLVIEIIWQVLFELVTSLGWESLAHSMRRERESHPVLAGIGLLILGVLGGLITLLVFPSRLTTHSPFPGVSLIASPLATGMVMHQIGEYCRERGWDRPRMFSFWGGATFAFGMAAVRYVAISVIGIR